MTAILEHPASPVHVLLAHPMMRRVLMGTAMGLTAIAIIYSPWGRRSGAHINPAVTLTFFRSARSHGHDAACYACAQFVGGVLGIDRGLRTGHHWIADPAVNYVATLRERAVSPWRSRRERRSRLR